MKNEKLIALLFVIAALMLCNNLIAQKRDVTTYDMSWASKTGAKHFPSSTRIFKVNAVTDTVKVITKIIQSTIDQCASNGGGVVVFAPGVYVTGSVFIKSGVQLKIDKGVLLLGSQSFDDYPEIDTRIAGIEMKWPAALINIIDARNAALTGDGTVNARGKFCWDKYWAMRKDYDKKGLRWIIDYDAKRVRTLLVQNSSDITLKGVTFKNAGFWTIQLLYPQQRRWSWAKYRWYRC
jgi:polygalacturonase